MGTCQKYGPPLIIDCLRHLIFRRAKMGPEFEELPIWQGLSFRV